MQQTFDHSRVTEDWRTPADPMQRRAASLRYELARQMVGSGLFLDVACGTGFGVNHLRHLGARAVGGDLSDRNIGRARELDSDGQWVRLDAQDLPIRNEAIDVVACFEALYYLPQPAAFVGEAHRVLRPGGQLLITVPNPKRPGFSTSPGSVAYYDPTALQALLSAGGFEPRVLGAFERGSGFLFNLARRVLARARLMPSTIEGRARLKRVLVRSMRPIAPLDTIDHPMDELAPIHPDRWQTDGSTVLYAFGRK